MSSSTCKQCGKKAATKTSPSGRPMCDECFAQFIGLAAAGTELADVGGPESAVGSAIAASGFAGAVDGEARHRAEQRRKLAAATGFWQRLKIRIIG